MQNLRNVKVEHTNCRSDKGFWSLQFSRQLHDLKNKTYTGVPDQPSIDLLNLRLYSDCTLLDVHAAPGLYQVYFISDILKTLIMQHNFLHGQIHFRPITLQWRGGIYQYHYCQIWNAYTFADICNIKLTQLYDTSTLTLAPYQIDTNLQRVDLSKSVLSVKMPFADADLINLPVGSFKDQFYCSSKFAKALQDQGITGFTISEDGPEIRSSNIQCEDKLAYIPVLNITTDTRSYNKMFSDELYSEFKKDFVSIDEFEQATFGFYCKILGVSRVPEKLRVSFKKWLTPAIGIKEATASNYALSSRWFGQPHLPIQLEWPRTLDAEARPLLFLGQINLTELPTTQLLPATGMLLFFLDVYRCTEGWPDEPGRNRIFFVEDLSILRPVNPPSDLLIQDDFKSIGLEFYRSFTFPDNERTRLYSKRLGLRFNQLFETLV